MTLKFEKMESNKGKELINLLHRFYLNRVENYYNFKGEQLTRFAWANNKKVRICGIEVYIDVVGRHKGFVSFATTSDTRNELLLANGYLETNNPSFSRYVNEKDRINWLVSKQLISKKLSKNILPASLKVTFGVFDGVDAVQSEAWMNQWVDKEYDSTLSVESIPKPIASFPLSNQKYFVDRYHFNDMLETINNEQFTDEFNQCLCAYNNQKWFLCASGLGSCLEHLLLIILQNYAENGFDTLKGLGYDPTAASLINNLRKEPINIDTRQERYIRLVFKARNAVSHYNSGYTSKELCDLMLTGISSIFNDYYRNSVEKYKEEK